MGKVIGIDLGTTNSCVAILEGGVTQIVPNKEGGRTTPSVVAFTEKGERLIGQIAKRQAITNSANTIYAVKRLMAVYELVVVTFDISMMEMADGVFEVLSTCGDSFLGGEDFDQRIVDWMIETFKQETGIDLRPDRLALQRLKEAAERAKCELSTAAESQLNLPFIAADSVGPKHFNKTLTRVKFEELVADLVARTTGPCQKALADAKLTPEEITKVLLV